MSARIAIVSQFLEAQKSRDPSRLDELAEHLAEDVVLASPMGNVEGKDALVSRLRSGGQGPAAAVMTQLSWGEPEEIGGKVTVTAALPEGLPMPIPLRGILIAYSFDEENRITRVEFTPQM